MFCSVDKEDEEAEHSLELQYPYLKLVLNEGTTIIPIMIGTKKNLEEITSQLLKPFFNDNDSLFLISTDFCHWGKRFNYTVHDKKNQFIFQSISDIDLKGVDAIKSKKRESNQKQLGELY